jgi:hypothetical protein
MIITVVNQGCYNSLSWDVTVETLICKRIIESNTSKIMTATDIIITTTFVAKEMSVGSQIYERRTKRESE